jgi:hypothetical protein
MQARSRCEPLDKEQRRTTSARTHSHTEHKHSYVMPDFRYSALRLCPWEGLPIWLQHAQAAGISPPKLHTAVNNVSARYNNLPTDREYVMCARDDEVIAARFYTSRVMMFCSTASVNHFCRLPSLIEKLGARLFGTLARAYVDDWVITDFVAAGDSAQQALAVVHRDIGIPLAACQHACCSQCKRNPRPNPPPQYAKCKRRRPSQIQELLGVVCNVSQAHAGSVHYSPKPTRCTKVLRELEAASKSKLTAKQAERLCGKLQFICNISIWRRGQSSDPRTPQAVSIQIHGRQDAMHI